jgi:hypothetical protein
MATNQRHSSGEADEMLAIGELQIFRPTTFRVLNRVCVGIRRFVPSKVAVSRFSLSREGPMSSRGLVASSGGCARVSDVSAVQAP